jgi:hypothetical protein
MATKGGSKPGERRGGREKGSLNKPRIVLKVDHPADRLARRAEAEVRAAKGDPKRCKDILSEWANLCGGIASRFRPTLVNGKPTWNTKVGRLPCRSEAVASPRLEPCDPENTHKPFSGCPDLASITRPCNAGTTVYRSPRRK